MIFCFHPVQNQSIKNRKSIDTFTSLVQLAICNYSLNFVLWVFYKFTLAHYILLYNKSTITQYIWSHLYIFLCTLFCTSGKKTLLQSCDGALVLNQLPPKHMRLFHAVISVFFFYFCGSGFSLFLSILEERGIFH